jgi:3-deoxy-7-phosphoheptulonate synthase
MNPLGNTIVQVASGASLPAVESALQALGLWTRRLQGAAGEVRALEVAAHSARVDRAAVAAVEGVTDILTPPSPHPRVDGQAGGQVRFGDLVLGGGAPMLLISGPCSVESESQIHAAAALVAEAGGRVLRGGAFKPRTSPYSFNGHGAPALEWLRDAARAHGLAVVTEVLGEADVEPVAAVADMLQVGSRNMQNFSLLKAIGRTGKPALLKRGMSARVEDWVLAGEHLLAAGASGVVFCERGINGFDTTTRNLLDLGAVALLKHALRQPVVVDPSHATGRKDLIMPLALAAQAVGADAVLVEAHPNPGAARSDGPQALSPEELKSLGLALGLKREGGAA